MKNTMNKTGGISAGDANGVNAGFNGASNAVEWNFMQELDIRRLFWEAARNDVAAVETVYENTADAANATVKFGYVLGTELTPLGDFERIVLGINPYGFNSLTPQQRIEALQDFAMWNAFKPAKIIFRGTETITKLDNTWSGFGKVDSVYNGINSNFDNDRKS